jgi:NAD kinase
MKIAVFGEALRGEVIASLMADKRISIVDDASAADVLLSLGGDGTLLDTLSIVGSRCEIGGSGVGGSSGVGSNSNDSGCGSGGDSGGNGGGGRIGCSGSDGVGGSSGDGGNGGAREIPVLGVNLGHLGFLTGATQNDIPSLAAMLLDGEFSTVKRSVLEVIIEDGDAQREDGSARREYALNEAAILRDENSSTISVDVSVDNVPLNNYRGDGVIFATPTGSTAYSLSCGGPVLPPEADNIIVTPIASHTLTVRSLVLTGNTILRAECSVPCKLTLDARNYSLTESAVITVKRAPFSFITMKHRNKEFFETLREKLSWGR